MQTRPSLACLEASGPSYTIAYSPFLVGSTNDSCVPGACSGFLQCLHDAIPERRTCLQASPCTELRIIAALLTVVTKILQQCFGHGSVMLSVNLRDQSTL